MGIPYLLKRLQHYAKPTVLGCTTPDCKTHTLTTKAKDPRIVIDGPCLAYFVYYRLLAQKSTKLGPLDCQPTYKELGAAVIAFLELLERCKLRMYAMFSCC